MRKWQWKTISLALTRCDMKKDVVVSRWCHFSEINIEIFSGLVRVKKRGESETEKYFDVIFISPDLFFLCNGFSLWEWVVQIFFFLFCVCKFLAAFHRLMKLHIYTHHNNFIRLKFATGQKTLLYSTRTEK